MTTLSGGHITSNKTVVGLFRKLATVSPAPTACGRRETFKLINSQLINSLTVYAPNR
jgi:hypothetical protein